MRVALIDPSLFTLPYDERLAEALQRRGHRIEFFGKALGPREAAPATVPLRRHFYGELRALGAERWPPALAKVAKGLSHIRAMESLVRVLARERPDVIHFQWLPLPVVDRAFLARFARIAPIVITCHDSQPFNANPGAAVQRVGATAILARFDRVIIHTDQARARLAAYGVEPRRIARIAHGFLDESAPAVAPPTIDADRPVRFLLFGKIKPYKGIDLMIEAVKRLPPAARRRIEVLVVGKPYMDTTALVAAAAGMPEIRFEFRFVPDEEMAELFRWADVLAFPYREIEMSGVLMAALKTARPMVASDIGGFAELLRDGETGFLVPPGDVPRLAHAIGRLVDEPGTRVRMAAGLVDLVRAIPSWDAIAAETEALYAAAIAERRTDEGRRPAAAPSRAA
ncbi:MAG TPA: glycosyltransferase family 4 protein [Aliidongia sp.]|uniref:glycosyltransferase family 4 protein n=1 Tax=Aliidongia sp. TaxID=1914230 RepID=UPI002DDD963A|nr:glycosyltransferase family 4 protein [Aliidongia sp.]HEV2673910.1 glycosyltransferase family 4 protein [Aliidongia sp.]